MFVVLTYTSDFVVYFCFLPPASTENTQGQKIYQVVLPDLNCSCGSNIDVRVLGYKLTLVCWDIVTTCRQLTIYRPIQGPRFRLRNESSKEPDRHDNPKPIVVVHFFRSDVKPHTVFFLGGGAIAKLRKATIISSCLSVCIILSYPST